MPHGCRIYSKAYDMEKDKMCAYTKSDNALPNWKSIILCCAKYLCINIHDQETDHCYSDTTPSIRFHIYHTIARFTDHGIISLKYNKTCRMFKQKYSSDKSTKIYTRKESVMMKTKISDFHISLYISYILRLAFHLSHVCILGINHCGELQNTAFKSRKLFQDVLFRRDYSERAVASFDHQIKPEYYGGNR